MQFEREFVLEEQIAGLRRFAVYYTKRKGEVNAFFFTSEQHDMFLLVFVHPINTYEQRSLKFNIAYISPNNRRCEGLHARMASSKSVGVVE